MDQLRYGRSRREVRQPHQVCEVWACILFSWPHTGGTSHSAVIIFHWQSAFSAWTVGLLTLYINELHPYEYYGLLPFNCGVGWEQPLQDECRNGNDQWGWVRVREMIHEGECGWGNYLFCVGRVWELICIIAQVYNAHTHTVSIQVYMGCLSEVLWRSSKKPCSIFRGWHHAVLCI